MTAAAPSAPVVAATPPNATVAPAAGADVVSVAGKTGAVSCSTLTVTVWPGRAVAGTPVTRSGETGRASRGRAVGEEEQLVALLHLHVAERPPTSTRR